MEPQNPKFNRVFSTILVTLFVIFVAVFNYINWAADPENVKWWMLVLNILILGIPFGLLFGSVYVLVVAWREHRQLGQVTPRMARVIHWAPRGAAILIIFFVTLFSLDTFGTGAPLQEQIVGFFIHSIPSILMLVVLIFAWKWPAVGFMVFLAAATFFTLLFVRDVYSLPNLLIFVMPILLISLLFYADWQWHQPQMPAPKDTDA